MKAEFSVSTAAANGLRTCTCAPAAPMEASALFQLGFVRVGVARSSADWSRLAARAELVFFPDAFGSEDEAATALADFDR